MKIPTVIVPIAFSLLFAASFLNCSATNPTSFSPLSTFIKTKLPKLVGSPKQAYNAAIQCESILGSLFCYCGCDETQQHNSLKDCFFSEEAVNEAICQEEVIFAASLKNKGFSLQQIQNAIDSKFGIHPVFPESLALKKYREMKLMGPNKVKNK